MRHIYIGQMKTDWRQLVACFLMVAVIVAYAIVEPGVRYVVAGFAVFVVISRRLAFKEWG